MRIIDYDSPKNGDVLVENKYRGSVTVRWHNADIEFLTWGDLQEKSKYDGRKKRYEIVRTTSKSPE